MCLDQWSVADYKGEQKRLSDTWRAKTHLGMPKESKKPSHRSDNINFSFTQVCIFLSYSFTTDKKGKCGLGVRRPKIFVLPLIT